MFQAADGKYYSFQDGKVVEIPGNDGSARKRTSEGATYELFGPNAPAPVHADDDDDMFETASPSSTGARFAESLLTSPTVSNAGGVRPGRVPPLYPPSVIHRAQRFVFSPPPPSTPSPRDDTVHLHSSSPPFQWPQGSGLMHQTQFSPRQAPPPPPPGPTWVAVARNAAVPPPPAQPAMPGSPHGPQDSPDPPPECWQDLVRNHRLRRKLLSRMRREIRCLNGWTRDRRLSPAQNAAVTRYLTDMMAANGVPLPPADLPALWQMLVER